MTPPRDLKGDRTPADDAAISRELKRWLADGEERAPDRIAEIAVTRADRTRQRPAWFARLSSPAAGGRPALGVAVVGAVAVLALALGIQATRLVGAPTGSSNPSGPAAESLAPSAPPPHLLELDSGSYPTGRMDNSSVGVGFGSVWVGAFDGGVARMNPDDGSLIARVEFEPDDHRDGEVCGALQPSTASMWFQVCGRGPGVGRTRAETVRLDPAANRISNVYSGGGPDGIGIGVLDQTVWFISDVPAGELAAVDELTGELLETRRVDGPIGYLAAGFGSLWVSPDGGLELWRIDPGSGGRISIPLVSEPGFIAVSADAVWVGLPDSGQLARIDPAQDRAVATFEVAPRVEQIVVTDRHVWAVGNTQLVGIDPTRNLEVSRFRVPAHRTYDTARLVMAGGNGLLWWADRTTLHEIPEP